VPIEKRVEVLYADPDVKVGRFGGEGTGGNAKLETDWALGERCRFLVRVEIEGQKTSYTGYFRREGMKEWKKLVTFRVTTGGQPLKGYYSFVEDFRRDGKSVGERRAAVYGPGWVKSTKGEWSPVLKASFGADGTKLDNIDAALSGSGFLLATGGGTMPSTKLKASLTLPDATRSAPDDLP
jgi:hypothetical protein